jgi:aryl-alcohol dehydrogenase-like predicted oxidoreductase
VERELIPMAKALDIGVTAWSPLASGVLTGKYSGGESEAGARLTTDMMKSQFMPDPERTARIVGTLKTVSQQVGRSMAQVALAWLRYRPVPIIPILGARKLSQLEDNLGGLDLHLSADQVHLLDDASRIELGFPHDFYAKEMVRTFVYGGLRDRIVGPD